MPTDRTVAIVHDYLTQRGGAERVVAVLAETFPAAPVYTSLYEPGDTFEAFAGADVRTGWLNRIAPLRRNYRAALPLLGPWFAAQRIDADVVLASSSGWAHEVRTDGRLVVYCHAPARWLYQRDRYLGADHGARRALAASALAVLSPGLRRLDVHAAHRADHYLANSSATAALVRSCYGIDAEVLCPPPAIVPHGAQRPVEGIDDGFVLCVSRLLPYKQVDVVVDAARLAGDLRIIVVGDGPDRERLERHAPRNVRFLGVVDDDELRWCYAHAAALVAVAYEDFGLTPLEAAGFGTPTVARRFGGYLDTVLDGTTGRLVADVAPATLVGALREVLASPPSAEALVAHAASFGERRFVERIKAVVAPS